MTALTGSAGNDSYAGALGVSDSAVIAAAQASAVFAWDGLRWTVTSAAGTDTLSSIESVQFADASFALTAAFSEPQVNTTTTYDQMHASVARLADGGWLVTWQSAVQDGSGDGVYQQRYSAVGEKVGSETLVNTTTDYAQQSPVTAGLADGGWVVAWQYAGYNALGTAYEQNVVLQRYDANGTKLGGEVFAAGTDVVADSVAIAATSGGGWVVGWERPSGASGGSTLYAQIYGSGGGKVGSELTLATAADSATSLDALQVAALGSGYVAVWTVATAAGADIFQQRVSSTGGKLGSATKVDGAEVVNGAASVAALNDGSYVVTWAGTAPGGYEVSVYAQRFSSAGAKVGGVLAVGGDAVINYGVAPQVVGLADGGFVVVWRGALAGTNDYGLLAQKFDAAGRAVGEASLAGTGGYGNGPEQPDIAALADGGFVVSWQEGGNRDGYGYGVFSQRFGADGQASLPRIAGDAGNNVITFGGAARIELRGGGGNDSLTGGSGADRLDGGAGNDTMVGGSGDDTYVWQSGDVIVEAANGGIDTVRTAVSYTLGSRTLENAVLTGSAKGDLIGNGAANKLTGNGADNVLNGGAGVDTLIGGGGSDTYVVDAVGERIVEAASSGIDTVIASATTVLAVNLEHLRLSGASAIDGTGNTAANLITGNANANRLDGADGADTLIGGLGDDTYVIDATLIDQIREYAGEGRDTIEIAKTWVLDSAVDSLENLTLREGGAYNGTGDAVANVIRGNSLANTLDGKAGADTMDGAGGDDIYLVDNAGDIAAELYGYGVDLVRSSVTHTLGAGIDNLTLLGTANRNGTGNTLWNVITGNSGANRLDGLGGADTLIGGAGNDTLASADGLDSLVGGTGDDSYVVNSENDEVVEKAAQGTDTVTATVQRAYTLADNVEKLVLIGGDIDGHGNTVANTITGTAGANLLDGGVGADTLGGLGGDDVYLVDNAGDVVTEAASAGIDEVFAMLGWTLGANLERLTLGGSAAVNGTGNTLANRLVGNDAANRLSALDGADLVYGYGGNDTLDGGAGIDTLVGGAGSDVFRFTTAPNTAGNRDRLSDFNVAADTIQLENAVFTAFTATGTAAAGTLRTGAGFTTAADANDYLVYNSTTGVLYYDADGSGAGASVQVALLNAGLALTTADFVII